MNLKTLSNAELKKLKEDVELEIKERIASLSQLLKKRTGRNVDEGKQE